MKAPNATWTVILVGLPCLSLFVGNLVDAQVISVAVGSSVTALIAIWLKVVEEKAHPSADELVESADTTRGLGYVEGAYPELKPLWKRVLWG